jgi:hypothetical protein
MIRYPSLAARSHSHGYAEEADACRRLVLVRETVAAPDRYRTSHHPVPDPLADMDALEELGDEIATLAAHIHAATQRMLVLLADFDRRRGWEIGGHRSCAHWLAYRTGLDLGAAREHVRSARVLVGLPRTSAAMARGELSFSQVRALSRVATPENEDDLLELARGATTAELERVVRGWKRGGREDEAAWERARHERRRLSVFPDEDGMYRVTGRLEPEVGALLMRAIEAASDALYRKGQTIHEARHAVCPGGTPVPDPDDDTLRAAAQRRADALGLLAERAMGVGFGCGAADRPDSAPISGTRAERYQVVLHVDQGTLREAGEAEHSHLEDGTRVSAETSRRLACDAGLVRITHRRQPIGPHAPGGADSSLGVVVEDPRVPPGSLRHHAQLRGRLPDVGRRTRTISPALRRALEARDRGCRFPGCGLRFTDGHHVRHWADGGDTSLDNTLLLCRHHHRLVHEGGWRVEWWGPGRPVFIDPRGGTHFDGRWRPRRPEGVPTGGRSASDVVGGPVAVSAASADILVDGNHLLGIDPDHRTAGARWKRIEDVPDEVLCRAMEAVG